LPLPAPVKHSGIPSLHSTNTSIIICFFCRCLTALSARDVNKVGSFKAKAKAKSLKAKAKSLKAKARSLKAKARDQG